MNRTDWPGWRTVRKIGSGGFGTVYEIEKETAGFVEKAALKVVSIPESDSDIEDYRLSGYDDESISKRYLEALQDVVNEYRVMKELKGCPSIVICDDVQTAQHEDGIGWDVLIKMELLTPLLKKLGKEVSDLQVIQIGKDLCAALMECEKRGVLHRDIKPQNIFVSDNGTYKLGDFGIAKAVEKTTRGTQTGTYKYMAPEVYHNEPYGPRADIYSLGLVLYWLLNERHEPFVPINNRPPTSSEEEIARMRRLSKEMAQEELPAPKYGDDLLKQIVCKACAYDPNDRYQSAAEFRDALEEAESRTAGVWPTPHPVPPTPPKPPIWKWVALGAVGLALICAVILLVNHKPTSNSESEDEAKIVETVIPTDTPEPTPTPVTGIRFTNYEDIESFYGVVLGNEITIEAELEPKGTQGNITWSSSNTKIADIDENGHFVAAYPGQVTITAQCGDVTHSCEFNVSLRDTFSHTDVTEAELAYFLTYVDEKVQAANAVDSIIEKDIRGGYYKGYYSNGKMLYCDMYEPYTIDLSQERYGNKTYRIYYDEATDEIYFVHVTDRSWDGQITTQDIYYFKGMLFRIVDNGNVFSLPTEVKDYNSYNSLLYETDYYENEYYEIIHDACETVMGYDENEL